MRAWLPLRKWPDRPVAVTVLATVAVVAVVRGYGFVNDWKYTHFLFTYQDEFLKRALTGEVLRWLPVSVTFESVFFLSVVLMVILAVVLLLIFSAPYLREKASAGLFLFGLVAISSPATIQHFAFDLGRFDVINLLLAIGCLFAIEKLTLSSAGTVVVIFMVTSLLVHEAAFFMYVPLVLAYWMYRDASKRAHWVQFGVALMTLIATFVISRWGQASLYSLDEHVAVLTGRYGNQVVDISVNVLHSGGLMENIRRTYYLGVTQERVGHHLLMLGMLLPLLYLIYRCVAVVTSYNVRAALMLLASISPLTLYPLGHDHFRWWALAITNLFVAISLLCVSSPVLGASIGGVFKKHQLTCGLAIGLGLASGPLGVTESFTGPIVRWLL